MPRDWDEYKSMALKPDGVRSDPESMSLLGIGPKLRPDPREPPPCCKCPPAGPGAVEQVMMGLWDRWLYYFWFGPDPAKAHKSRVVEPDLRKAGVRGHPGGSKQCCECLPNMEALPTYNSNSFRHAPPLAPELPSLESMLHDGLVVRMFMRLWGRLPPLGTDQTSERALLGNAAITYMSDERYVQKSWQGWVDTLHRLGATSLLKELPVWRSIRAPRKPAETEIFATIDTLWQDLMAQGGMSQADIDETASMGLSGQDAQRLEAVSTACKGAVPDEEDETWCMDALPFKGKVMEKYERCALVGNSQRLLLGEAGAAIDSHDAVLRLNTAHTFNIKQFTGSKTTFRLLSKDAVKQYLEDIDGELALAGNETVIAMPSDYTDYFQLVHAVRQRSKRASTMKLQPAFVKRAEALLHQLRQKLETILGVQYSGPSAPSAGFVGLAFLTSVCAKVDVYGVLLGDVLAQWDPHNTFRAPSSSFHYYEENGYLFQHPRIEELAHSWELEHDVLQILEGAGHIRHHLAPVRNPVTEEEVMQHGVDKVNEANCIRKPGQMWSPFRHMCVTE